MSARDKHPPKVVIITTTGSVSLCLKDTPQSPNIGPLISRWELDEFKNCWSKIFRTSEIPALLYQQLSNLLIPQRDMSGPTLGTLSNNRWLGGTYLRRHLLSTLRVCDFNYNIFSRESPDWRSFWDLEKSSLLTRFDKNIFEIFLVIYFSTFMIFSGLVPRWISEEKRWSLENSPKKKKKKSGQSKSSEGRRLQILNCFLHQGSLQEIRNLIFQTQGARRRCRCKYVSSTHINEIDNL